jgi:hypothetical protein
MKHNISDLLDDLPVGDMELQQTSLLSSRRIKERTMGIIGAKNKTTIRLFGRVAAIAAAIMLLTVSVLAADVALNDGALFGNFFGTSLSGKQIQVIDDIGRTFGESITSNGTTITPIRAVADKDHYFLHLRVEAPEGVVLPDVSEEDGYYYDFQNSKSYYYNVNGSKFPHDSERRMKLQYETDMYGQSLGFMSFNHGVSTLFDEDPTDNVKEFVIRLHSESNSVSFNGPSQKYLTFYGLYIQRWGHEDGRELLRGVFNISIGLNDENREDAKLEIDAGDISYYNEENDFTTTLHKITITPLTITLDYTCTDPNNKYIFGKGGPIQMVMKDGSTVEAVDAYLDASSRDWPHPDSIVGVGNYTQFKEPVVLEDIDYLIVGYDGVIFDVN